MVVWVRLRWVQGAQGEWRPLCHPPDCGAASLAIVGEDQLLCYPQKAPAVGSVHWVMSFQGQSLVRPTQERTVLLRQETVRKCLLLPPLFFYVFIF